MRNVAILAAILAGRELVYAPKPNYRLTTNDEDPSDLTDGKLGERTDERIANVRLVTFVAGLAVAVASLGFERFGATWIALPDVSLKGLHFPIVWPVPAKKRSLWLNRWRIS